MQTVNSKPNSTPPTEGRPCRKCGSTATKTARHSFRDGTVHVKLLCAECGKFKRYVRKESTGSEPNYQYPKPSAAPASAVSAPERKSIDPARLGLACASCGSTTFTTAWHRSPAGEEFLRLICGTCKRLQCDLPAAAFLFQPRPFDAHDDELQPPPQDWQWIGMIRQTDMKWRAVAWSGDLGRCWDSLLTYPGKGDFLVIPTKPSTP